MNFKNMILSALRSRYVAEAESAKANIEVYLNSPVGIGEHSDLVGSVDTQVEELASALEKISTLGMLIKEYESSEESD